MDNKKQSIHYKKCLFCESMEHQLESQLNLPDYYPDVCRILTCKVNTYVENSFADGDRINADGIAVIKLLYCAEDKTIHLFESEQRFTKGAILKNTIQAPIVRCSYQTENVYYRAVGPRRIDIRTCIKLSVDVSVIDEITCPDSSTDGVEALERAHDLFDISSCCSDMFVINEDFSLHDERIKESKIMHAEAQINTTEIKCVRDKILIKGNAELNLLYLYPKDQIMFKYYETIPFSQIIELAGIRETDKIFASMKAQQPVLTIKESGECELSLCVIADITAGECVSAHITEDIFGSGCEVNITHDRQLLHKNARIFKDTFSALSDNEKTEYKELQILSYYSTAPVFKATVQDEKLTVNGYVQIVIIAQSEEGFVCLNRNIQFDYNREIEFSCEADTHMNIICSSLTCNETGNGIQLKAELELLGYCLFNENCSFVSSCEIQDSEKQSSFDTVTLYFAERGEAIWDIAKQHRVRLQTLKESNELTGEYIDEDKVLILLHTEVAI